MHASAVLALVIGTLGAVASPVSSPNNDVHQLVRRANQCKSLYGGSDIRWSIYLDNDAYYNKKCGNGCLDNIRGRCGVVTSWECSRDANNRAHMNFYTTIGCSNYDMTQALHACTKKEQTIDCTDSGINEAPSLGF
ncbi:hypothetical protein UCDDS831_g08023 [Diplodia seriata]|uniref:Secreted protein n=1 Tax=Diplodia seriata TaxID=420778 RepID=A0A0G2DX78_9PEZI|nr:hypothetical protein UCDDS831_g08023 [Diplodia seriata]